MRTRVKALTVSVAMVTAFAILPTVGAAAAEPLEDGSYEVAVGEQTYTVEVVDGIPAVDAEGVEFVFAFDEETGRVLDEFDVTVGEDAYDVTVGEDGTVSVVPVTPEEPVDEEPVEDPVDEEPIDEEPVEEPVDEPVDEEPADEPVDEEALEEEGDEVEEDGAHGELVSGVAQCAPRGKDAREAGLPNHGFFVSAAAQGRSVDFEVDGEAYNADLSTPEGAAAFCELAAELLAAAEEPADEEPTGEETEGAEVESDEADEDRGNRGNGNGKGRDNAPGQQKKND